MKKKEMIKALNEQKRKELQKKRKEAEESYKTYLEERKKGN